MSRCWYCECGNPAGFGDEGGNGISIHVEPFFGRWVIRVSAEVHGEKATMRMPINHCPFCGRALKDETPPELYIDYRTRRHSRSWRSDADGRDVSTDGPELTSETSGSVARTLLEAWEDMA